MRNKLVGNPWLKMWTHPRETVRSIVDSNPSHHLWGLSAFYGFVMMLQSAQNTSLGDKLSAPSIVLICALLAAPVGWLSFYIMGGILTLCGKWIGGKGSFKNVRTALAWSNVTSVANTILWLMMLFAFGDSVFTSVFPDAVAVSPPQRGFLVFVFGAQLILAIWSLILLLKALGEVQGFSVWKALLNVILPLMLIFFALWIIGTIANLGSTGASA